MYYDATASHDHNYETTEGETRQFGVYAKIVGIATPLAICPVPIFYAPDLNVYILRDVRSSILSIAALECYNNDYGKRFHPF